MFNLFKSKPKQITIDLTPRECELLQSTFTVAKKTLEAKMKIDGLSDREKVVVTQKWPDQNEVY